MQRDAGGEESDPEVDELSVDASDPEVQKLLTLIESCDQALLLSGAERRGADLVLAELDEKIESFRAAHADKPAHGSTGASWPIDRVVAPEFADFIAKVLESPAEIASIEQGLDALVSDPRRVALKAACALDQPSLQANGSGLFAHGADRANAGQTGILRAEAEGELCEYDMAPGSPAYVLAARLQSVGITASPLDVSEVTTDLLAQIEQAKIDRDEYENSTRQLTGAAADVVTEREQVAIRRASAARRQSTQQHLRRIARSQLDQNGARARGLMPVLIEDPFLDLPNELAGTTLAMLRRHSAIAQVILVTNRSDVRRWCNGLGSNVEAVVATGWFAEEHDGW